MANASIHTLIIGAGGREHALGWKLKQSKNCGRLYFAPGNGGTGDLGENVHLAVDPVNAKNLDALLFFCRDHQVALVVIGPEAPLAHGLTDQIHRRKKAFKGLENLRVFGPTAEGARLEADKAYAKELMRAASIPTAEARAFTDFDAAVRYAGNRETPVVVKAAGLAKGKGVVVTSTPEEAVEAVRRCMKERLFGEAGQTVVIEERLVGQEVSILALVDGRNIYVLDPAQDHKPVHEGDTGPNTGGMGAYCPTPLVDDALMTTIQREALVPIVDAMYRSETDYRGVLYAGLMLTAGGPKVLEYNCRFGDPETQPLMMRLKGDLLETMLATCGGELARVQIDFDPRPCVCVVLASGGYPGDYQKGMAITGVEDAEADPDVKVFHAGTGRDKAGRLVTDGGRVLSVCALADDLESARARANAACDKIHFRGAHFRRDIGSRVLSRTGHASRGKTGPRG